MQNSLLESAHLLRGDLKSKWFAALSMFFKLNFALVYRIKQAVTTVKTEVE